MDLACYRVPATLSDFQRTMYIHLIDWKREHITREPGTYRARVYDAAPPSRSGMGSVVLRSLRNRVCLIQ